MKRIFIISVLTTLLFASDVSAQPGSYFQAQIKKSGSDMQFIIRPNPASNGGANITNFRFDNLDFFVRVPSGEAAPVFGAPVVNTTDFPGLTITQDPFGAEAYGSEPGYRIIEWSSPSAGSTNIATTYNAGQEYIVFTVPVSVNFSPNLQFSADNIAGAPYFLTITRNTAGIGGVSDFTAQGANGSSSTQLFYTTGSASLLSFTPPNSYYQLLTDLSTLPVTFNNYDVKCNDKGALISWSTSTEQNSEKFEIQRSINGNDWIVIDQVAAAGNSDVLRNYQYLDLKGGVAFYRIRQVDKDERFVYTTIKRTDCKVGQFDVTLYPVPARDDLTVVIRSDRAVRTDLQIMDMNGRVIRRTVTQVNQGNNNIVLDVSDLPGGQYLLTSSNPSILINKKFTIAR